jgi:hypothetical protein
MSGWQDYLNSIGASYVGNCLGYEDTILTRVVAGVDYYPVYLILVMCAFSITYCEVFLWLLTMVYFIDAPVNYGLQALIGPSDNIQPSACLPHQDQMPATGMQQVTVYWVVGWGMVLAVFPRPVRTWLIALFTLSATLALYTRVYLMFNSTVQLLVGMAVGLVEGVVYLMLLQVLVNSGLVPLFTDAIVGWFSSGISTWLDPNVITIRGSRSTKVVNVIIDS